LIAYVIGNISAKSINTWTLEQAKGGTFIETWYSVRWRTSVNCWSKWWHTVSGPVPYDAERETDKATVYSVTCQLDDCQLSGHPPTVHSKPLTVTDMCHILRATCHHWRTTTYHHCYDLWTFLLPW